MKTKIADSYFHLKVGEFTLQGKEVNEELSKFNGFTSFNDNKVDYVFRIKFCGYEEEIEQIHDGDLIQHYIKVKYPKYEISIKQQNGKFHNLGEFTKTEFYKYLGAYFHERQLNIEELYVE
jgi:hypothetical protein